MRRPKMADRLGQQFGNYRLVSLLGQGGYAEVYLGQHVRFNQQAAIKVLHAHLSGVEAEHFQQEAETIATLNASRQALRNNGTMGKSMWKIEEKEGTYDSPNHFTPIRYSNLCRVASPL